MDKAIKTVQNVSDTLSVSALNVSATAGALTQDNVELNNLKMRINEIEQELELKVVELEKRMKQNAILREKARAEQLFKEEKTKLDRAFAMDVLSEDEYNFKLSIARKKVDNFEEIRRIEHQFDMGIITKEEKNAKIEALIN